MFLNAAVIMAVFLFLPFRGTAQLGVTIYSSGNSSLVSNSVNDVAIGGDGRIWAATAIGLNEFDGSSNWILYDSGNSGLSWVQEIHLENDSIIWLGTFQGGLNRFDGTNWQSWTTSNSMLPSDHVRAIATTPGGIVWIGTTAGLVKMVSGNMTVYDFVGQGLESDHIASILPVGEDSAWIGTINGGLLLIADTTVTAQTLANSGITDNTVLDLVKDGNGDLWTAHPAGGLGLFTNLVWFGYNPFNSGNPATTLEELVLDGSDDVWMASLSQGLIYYDVPNWRHWDMNNSTFPADDLSSLDFHPTTGHLWAGAPGVVLLEIDTGILTHFSEPLDAQVRLFPNPNQGQFTLELPEGSETYELEVTDLQGKVVHSQIGVENGTRLDLTELPGGMYWVRIHMGVEKKVIPLIRY